MPAMRPAAMNDVYASRVDFQIPLLQPAAADLEPTIDMYFLQKESAIKPCSPSCWAQTRT